MLQARGRGVRVQSSRDVTCSGKCADGARVGQAWMRWATVLFLGVVSSAVSATGPSAVSGSITEDTRWVLSESPYLLTGDVTISSGAVLTIESGVRILMGADASLIVSEGGLSASGTETQPILITSEREEAGIASPGDWGSLRFDDGTRDAVSTLSYVRIRYGSGVVIRSASPTFDDVSIDHHAAPAITLDLNSSPTGHGLHAEGNALNGILVPAGAITTDTAWRLKGIPYVVAEGVVEVGLPPFGFNPSNLTLVAGRSGQLILDLPILAPGGGKEVALSSSAPSVAQVASTVTVPAGKHSVEIPVTALAHGSATLTADGGIDLGTAQAAVTVTPLPPLALTPSTLLVGKTHVSSMEVGIPAPAASDVRVTLSTVPTGIAQVPEEVVIMSGARSASFEVRGDNAATTTLRAEADGYATASAAITVRLPVIDAPAHAFVAPELSTDLILALSDPAPPGGIVVGIHNSAPSILGVPASVSLAAGETQVTVPLAGLLDSVTPATLTFSATGHQTATTQVAVRRIVAILGDGAQERSIPQGRTISLPVSLSAVAPPGGVTLDLAAAIEGIIDVEPAQVFVPEGQTTAVNNVSISGVSQGLTVVTLRATPATPGVDGLHTVRVTTPLELHFEPERIDVGKALYKKVDLLCWADGVECDFDDPVVITLSNSGPGEVSVPAQIILAAHTFRTSFNVEGVNVTTTDVNIGAEGQMAGIGMSPIPLKVRVMPAEIHFSDLNEDPFLVGADRRGFSICWEGGDVADSRGITVLLQILSEPVGIIDGIYSSETSNLPIVQATVPAGERCVLLYVGSPSAAGAYRVQVNVSGLGQWISSAVSVVKPKFEVRDTSVIVGNGLTAQVHVYSPYSAIDFDSISVISTDPVVEVSAGRYSSREFVIYVSGIGLTDEPIQVSIDAPGFDPLQLDVSVVPRRLVFSELDGRRSVNGDRDYFSVGWVGNYYSSMDLQNASIYLTAIGEAASSTLPTPAVLGSSSNSPWAYFDGGYASAYVVPPIGMGSYRVSAELDGEPVALSDLQTVGSGFVGPGYGFQDGLDLDGSVPVGQGLKRSIPLRLFSDTTMGSVNFPGEDVIVRLESRAESLVSVPQTITFRAGQFPEVYVPITGLAATNFIVAVDAYLDGDLEPSFSFDVHVYDPTLIFDMPLGRAINGPNDPMSLSWKVRYPCSSASQDPDEIDGPRICSTSQLPAEPQTLQLEIDGDPARIVEGFTDSEGNPVASVYFSDEDYSSEVVYAQSAGAAGSYRVQASLGPSGIWLSELVTVDAPKLQLVQVDSSEEWAPSDQMVVGLDLRYLARVEATVAGWPVEVGDDVEIQVSCTNPIVCEVDDEVMIGAHESSAWVGIVGRHLGTTHLVADAVGLQTSAPFEVSVVEPELQVSIASYLDRGDTSESRASLRVTESDQLLQAAATDLTVTLASLIPTVASIEPATITIPAGDKYSGPALLRGLRTGTTAVTARGAHMRPYVSQPITVTGN